VQTTFNEINGVISPDGRWVAYQSNESGQFEIYVRPFPDANSGRWQISTGSGTRPLWARSGKELFYVGPSGAVMSVAVEGGSTFRSGSPTRLLEGPYFLNAGNKGRTYDVSPDGQRFLMIKVGRGSAPTSIIVVQHWFEELKRLVPTNDEPAKPIPTSPRAFLSLVRVAPTHEVAEGEGHPAHASCPASARARLQTLSSPANG
jgi:serine/threonine-protein kinase